MPIKQQRRQQLPLGIQIMTIQHAPTTATTKIHQTRPNHVGILDRSMPDRVAIPNS
ncbi:MAG TPA: hypothetical protein VJT49_18425 [Amycolatopsis sp.]|uniref:hypothetical protein n=1 Tax=Amycolatopsis sp. TaxID=37632 RepID=UPI002B48A066|nr:hypothetical protein [Amycolatopsis sp.]HKS47045.1 hypothetical protein [Amycolatopsis sp.]